MSKGRGLMWGSLGLIAWSYAGYPLAAAAAARLRHYAARRNGDYAPDVALVIAAHNEERVLADRLANALELDYPGKVEVVVASDGSTDGTPDLVRSFADRGVRLLELPRGGKVAAQDAAVATTSADVLAFSDANSRWERDSLRRLVRDLADPEVGYVCGTVRVDGEGGSALEGLYWRFELWLRAQESACGSITGGNGGIYALRRSAYLELGSERSHDLGLPFRLRRSGLRALYDPDAVAHEPALPTVQDEWPRKVRMLSRAWWEVLAGGMLDPRGQPPGYFVALVSHRVLRYASGPLHLLLLATSLARAPRDRGARALLVLQAGGLALALAGRRPSSQLPLAGATWYYVVLNAASVAGLLRALSRGPDVTWNPERGGE
jgi:cellulose synthase/poly-beta-1,6-N-acetylglucosamine synthase-like glycosyltransferase